MKIIILLLGNIFMFLYMFDTGSDLLIMGTFNHMQLLAEPTYLPLNKISRSLHFDDVQDAHKRNGLVSQPIGNTRIHSLKQLKVLWFAPAKSMDENNFYGNISYVIDWSEVLDEFGPYMYVIDQAILNHKSYSRILLTNVRHNDLSEITQNMLQYHGGPIMKYHNGQFFHASRSLCNRVLGEHELQIGIQHTKRNMAQRRLFQLCSEIPNDHSDVNVLRYNHQNLEKKYQSFKCYKYNTAKNQVCPYAFDKNEAENYLLDITGSTLADQQDVESVYNYEPSNNPIGNIVNNQSTGLYLLSQQDVVNVYNYEPSNNPIGNVVNIDSTRSYLLPQQDVRNVYNYEPRNNPVGNVVNIDSTGSYLLPQQDVRNVYNYEPSNNPVGNVVNIDSTGSYLLPQQDVQNVYNYEPSNNPVGNVVNNDTTQNIINNEEEDGQIIGYSFPDQQENENVHNYEPSYNRRGNRRSSDTTPIVINDEEECQNCCCTIL